MTKVNDRKLITQPYDMSVHSMIDQIEKGEIILNPDYQRKYRWGDEKASRFIESLLLNIPIPNIFFAEEEDITYSVIDGQQRLTSLYNFIHNNSLQLEKLDVRNDLNGKYYSDLSSLDKGRLNKQYLRCSVILNESDEQIKFDVFERLNSGSAALTDQEVRNCIYRGTLNDTLKELAKNKLFTKMLRLSKDKLLDMTREEYILRFIAYRDDIENYDGLVKIFFNNYMKKNKNPENIEYYINNFTATINDIYNVLGEHSFLRYIEHSDKWHTTINKAIFDSEMIAFSNYSFDDLSKVDIKNFKNEIKELMSNEEFIKAVKSSTNSSNKVNIRIHMMEEIVSKYGKQL